MTSASVRDIQRCLAAIRSYSPDRASVRDTGAWSCDVGSERWVYVEDPPRDECRDGEIYFTFIVHFDIETDELLRVTHYRSKKGPRGDQTLPP